MKIKGINELANIGILDNDAYVNNFKLNYMDKDKEKYASKILIKGNNGTGKSTFSNLFRSVEKNDVTNSIMESLKTLNSSGDINVEIELEDKTKLKYSTTNKKWENADHACFKVFNQDYIEENINFNNFSENKIDGKIESTDISITVEKKEYEKCKKDLEELKSKKEKAAKDFSAKVVAINKEIKKETDHNCIVLETIENYNIKENSSNNFENDIIQNIKVFKEFKNADDFKSIEKINFNTKIEIEDLKGLLEYEEDRSKIEFMDEMLKLSSAKKDWIDKGLIFIEEEHLEECPFCKSDIKNNNLIKNYMTYIKSSAKQVENKLKGYILELKEIEKTGNCINNKMILLDKYSYLLSNKTAFNDKSDFEKACNEIIKILERKVNNIYIKSDEFKSIQEKWVTIKNILEKAKIIDECIETINNKMIRATTELTSVRKKIKESLKEKVEIENKENIKEYKKLINDINEKSKEVELKLQKYNNKLAESDKTIKEINKWFEFYGLSKYCIDKDFNLMYKNINLKDKKFILSTGEISAIAFSYFVSSLITGLSAEEKIKLIIIIDDPVDSVDYNRIYSFTTTIKIIQGEISANPESQLIVLTHNMLLYNILIQTSFMRSQNAKSFNLYLENGDGKILEKKNHKDTLFVNQLAEIINVAKSNDELEIERAYIYNDIRSVIENLGYLIDPAYSDNSSYDKLKKFFNIPDLDFEKLQYIVNNNSHNEPMLNIEKWFDSQLLKECCTIISNIMKDKFEDLYKYCEEKE